MHIMINMDYNSWFSLPESNEEEDKSKSLLFNIVALGHIKGKFIRSNHSTLHCCSDRANCCCNVCHGHMAVFRAPLYASEQVFVPPYPLTTPQTNCPLRYRSPLQSPSRGSLTRHFWRGPLISSLGDDCKDSSLFFQFCSDQNRRWSLWTLVAR